MFFISRTAVITSLGHRCSSLFSVENVLNHENMKRTIGRFQAMRVIRMQPNEPPRKAAVLIPLCVVDKKVSLLYTLRAPHLKSHRGQVSFPGGMQDINDENLLETALRETKEELGIKRNDVEIWGTGNIIVTRKETSVLPIIGRLKHKEVLKSLRINSHEVEEVFTVSLEELCDPGKIGHTQFRGAYSTPVFLGGKRRIWGLTAMITSIFLQALLPSKAYTHRFKYIPSVKMSGPLLFARQ